MLHAVVTIGQETGAASCVGEEEHLIRQRAPLSLFPGDSSALRFVTAPVDARLFGADCHPLTGEASVTVAHEALLRVWQRAFGWAERNRDFLLVRARLAARLQAGSPLLEGDPLFEAARAHLARKGEGFTAAQRQFIEDSVSRSTHSADGASACGAGRDRGHRLPTRPGVFRAGPERTGGPLRQRKRQTLAVPPRSRA